MVGGRLDIVFVFEFVCVIAFLCVFAVGSAWTLELLMDVCVEVALGYSNRYRLTAYVSIDI